MFTHLHVCRCKWLGVPRFSTKLQLKETSTSQRSNLPQTFTFFHTPLILTTAELKWFKMVLNVKFLKMQTQKRRHITPYSVAWLVVANPGRL